MFDNIMLLLAAFLVSFLGVMFFALNTSNNVGPYFISGLCFIFSALAVRVAVKYWKVA